MPSIRQVAIAAFAAALQMAAASALQTAAAQGPLKMVWSFSGNPDGAYPQNFSGLTEVNGVLYGTTSGGGSGACKNPGGYGTVYEFNLKTQAVSVVYRFTGNCNGGTDGAQPFSGLVFQGGKLYGTTTVGGTVNQACPNKIGTGCGTVFAVGPNTRPGTSAVYNFNGGASDGYFPSGALAHVAGMLYGTTQLGGKYGFGTVFMVNPNTNPVTETVLYSFEGGANDGAYPQAGVVAQGGFLYGTTTEGGLPNCGAVNQKFSLPMGSGCGTVFQINLSTWKPGMPGMKPTMLYAFTGGSDGGNPVGGVISQGGLLYGTAAIGGLLGGTCQQKTLAGQLIGCGVVFEVNPNATQPQYTMLYSFQDNSDGRWPEAGVVSRAGVLYGTTSEGGAPPQCVLDTNGCGTVFGVSTTVVKGKPVVGKILTSSFTDIGGDRPFAPLIDVNGTFYGTTNLGGGGATVCTAAGPGTYTCGTLFRF